MLTMPKPDDVVRHPAPRSPSAASPSRTPASTAPTTASSCSPLTATIPATQGMCNPAKCEDIYVMARDGTNPIRLT